MSGVTLEKSQATIIQQEKLASIGQLSAGIVHEINTPLSFITSNISRLGSYIERLTSFMDQVVAAHGGNIEIDSSPGSGTIFRILLPIDKSEGTSHGTQ